MLYMINAVPDAIVASHMSRFIFDLMVDDYR